MMIQARTKQEVDSESRSARVIVLDTYRQNGRKLFASPNQQGIDAELSGERRVPTWKSERCKWF